MSTVALVVAAGRGVRAGGELPKQYRLLGGEPVLRRAVRALARHPRIDRTLVAIHPDNRERFADVAGDLAGAVPGGATRQASVRAGLEAIASAGGAERVLIHDAARPLLPRALVDRVLDALEDAPGAVPALPVVDTLWSAPAAAGVDRSGLYRVQTPQGFQFEAILAAHRAAGTAEDATDDATLLRGTGLAVALVPGDEAAMKLTTPEDFVRAEALLAARMVARTGVGFDVHRFGPGDHLMLCGVAVPHAMGVVGHSDADVGLHALTDAILGAIGEGDIGLHFPPSDPQWRGAASHRFLTHAAGLVAARGGVIDHVDVTIIAERPKVGPHREAMRDRLAELLRLHPARVSVKATTTERLGFTGRGEGIACQAAATVRLPAEEELA